MKFTDLFIRRPVLALVVSLLILLIGLKCMLGLQIRQYPRLYNTTITVTTAGLWTECRRASRWIWLPLVAALLAYARNQPSWPQWFHLP